ncbi:unnamed protein product, partial [Mesorhabditis belari]|uniref:Uncharacterized protein n=1 Tax=Mesorhabditis belari TaxID=2138241 RepID=A0AAF3EN91_9BILA
MKVLQMILIVVLFFVLIPQSESTPLMSRRMKRRLIMRQPMMDMPFEDVLDMHNLGASTQTKRNFFPISTVYELW